MTEDEIKTEFSKHPANAPVMLAFRAWLVNRRDAAIDGIAAPTAYPHQEHKASGMLVEAKETLHEFDSVMAENEKRRRATDATPHGYDPPV